ncbi:MAG: DUF2272 domain-containing protein [Rubrivivax sp.]|nr:DUF2272 domain-containing protein [Rubrivivax sp.]
MGGKPVLIPELPDRLRFIALQEWELWGRGRWITATHTFEQLSGVAPRTEDAPETTSRVLHSWYSLKSSRIASQRVRFDDGSLVPWSALFNPFLMRSGGIAPEVFPPGDSHRACIRAILEAPNRNGFEALGAAAHAPALGNVICAPRGVGLAPAQARSLAELTRMSRQECARGQAHHCDRVVETAANTLGTIGGNINESVMWTQVGIDERGLLQPTPERPWNVVLRNHLRQAKP